MDYTKIRFAGLTPVDFPIAEALPSDRYLLKNVDGLGPPEGDVAIANTLYQGGEARGRRSQLRELVARVGLQPDYRINQTASDLRRELYGLLTPGAGEVIDCQLMNGNVVVAETNGIVRRIEIVPFAKEPEVQITVPCLQTYLSAPAEVDLVGLSKADPTILNVGDAPSGLQIELTLTANLSSWSLSNYNSTKKMQFDYAFHNGDTIKIDTRPGSRSATVTRGSTETSLISALAPFPGWFMLGGGSNVFHTSSQAFTWGPVSYLPQYWGV